MHEITYAQGILVACLKEAKGRRVSRIKIELVKDNHLKPQTLGEAFKLISKGTLAEGAVLEIRPREFNASGNEDFTPAKILELEVEED